MLALISCQRFGRFLVSRTFLRRRIDFGVTSTNSSSAMNSMACLEAQLALRNQANRFVRARRAHVGLLLFLGDVHVHVGFARIFADDHAFVHFDRRVR